MQETRPAPSLPVPWLLLSLALALGGVGCATLGEQSESLVPTRYRTTTGPYAVYSNFPIKADAPAIRSLHSLEADVESSLGIRVRADAPPIEVYILKDRQTFSHFLNIYYPELPPRRAFFLAQGSQRVVFTFLGDRLEEDLRHEACHALLNVVYGDLPLWLDEGLAEYFEGPHESNGVNREHLTRLPGDLAAGWTPDLARLEALRGVNQMDPRDYRESWAWVHYLLNGAKPGKAVLLAYLAEHLANPDAPPLSQRLRDDERTSPKGLVAHLDRVRAMPVAGSPSEKGSTIRLQDNTLDPARNAPARRGFFGRVRGLFGL